MTKVISTKSVHQKMGRPLRSGNAYQKGDKTSKPTEKNPKNMESVPVSERLNMKMLDLSWDFIRKSQETDVTLQKIFELLRNPDAPTEVNQFGMGVVNLWNQRKSLEVINGVIHRNYETAEGLILYKQILVPAPLRAKFYIGPWRSNFGTLRSTEDCRQTTTICLLVRVEKGHGTVRPTLRPMLPVSQRAYTSSRTYENGVGLAPFQKFHIDLTGSHRRSSGGHVYLLTGICCFTKYLVVVPLKDKSALTVANALLKHVYLIYGAVELQVHDNGPEFVNAILGHLSRMMGIQDLRSTPYRPVANSAIERTHRTIKRSFRQDNQRTSKRLARTS